MKFSDLSITIDGSIVKQVDNVKFLGLTIDSCITWKPHIDLLCSKVAKTIGILHKIKHFVPQNVLKILYNSLIFSNLSYCNLVWGNTYNCYLNRIYILQKRAIRLITRSDFSIEISDLFKSLNTLSVFNIHKHQLGVFMYKINNNMLPSKFTRLFKLNDTVHNYFTRNSSNYHVVRTNTDIGEKSLVFVGTHFWNKLPPSLKNCCSITIFRSKLKTFLLSPLDI